MVNVSGVPDISACPSRSEGTQGPGTFYVIMTAEQWVSLLEVLERDLIQRPIARL